MPLRKSLWMLLVLLQLRAVAAPAAVRAFDILYYTTKVGRTLHVERCNVRSYVCTSKPTVPPVQHCLLFCVFDSNVPPPAGGDMHPVAGTFPDTCR